MEDGYTPSRQSCKASGVLCRSLRYGRNAISPSICCCHARPHDGVMYQSPGSILARKCIVLHSQKTTPVARKHPADDCRRGQRPHIRNHCIRAAPTQIASDGKASQPGLPNAKLYDRKVSLCIIQKLTNSAHQNEFYVVADCGKRTRKINADPLRAATTKIRQQDGDPLARTASWPIAPRPWPCGRAIWPQQAMHSMDYLKRNQAPPRSPSWRS